MNRCICMRRSSDSANTRVLKLKNQKELLQAETAQTGRLATRFQPQSVSPTTHLLPVQLATYVATIANNGERLKTHIVDKVTNYERTKTVKSTNVESYGDCGISKKNLDIVRKAMLGVTRNENGTANYMFGDYKVKVAAKTGTAENSGSRPYNIHLLCSV